MKKVILAFTVLLLFISGIPGSTSAQHINIGSAEKFPPFNYTDKGGNYIGIDVTIIEMILDEIEVTYSHKPRPWKRAIAEFESGRTDMLFQLTPKPERFTNWYMVGPIRKNISAYFVKADSKIQEIKSLSDLKGLRVGVMNGYKYFKEFDEANIFTKDPVHHTVQNVRKLFKGRVDVVIETEQVFKYEIKMADLEGAIRMLPTPAVESTRYAAFRRTYKGKHLSELFQNKLDELKSKGVIQQTVDTWQE